MATVKFELRDNPDKAGMCRLRIIIQDKGKKTYVPMSLKLLPKYWDKNLQRVDSKHPQATALNNILTLRMADLQAQMANDELKGKVNINKLAGRDVEQIPFRQFALECLIRWEKTKSKSTKKTYDSMLRKVNEFDPNATLHSITPDWLMRYEDDSRDVCTNTGALKRVAFVSVILKEAIRQGKLERDPFLIYRKPKKNNPQKIWLTLSELAEIEKLLAETKSDTLQNTISWFLFACYSGFRYSDCVQFNAEKHIVNGRIILYTQKTGEVVSMKLSNKLNYIIPFIINSPLFTNQKINQYLKAVGHACKINKTITFHSARHTFAVNCANLGISQEVASKLLGHSDLKTTGIYYKIINSRIDEEMKKWDL